MTLKLFVSHSSHTDQSRKLRDAVAEHLDAQPGIEVLWDRNILPGTRWRTELDQWLAECTGGVVLFSQDAVASCWVLKEAQILTWRNSVLARFPLVPVLLEPVTADQTGLEDWQPVQINEVQFLPGGDPETMDDAARQQLAEEIAKKIKKLNAGAGDEELEDPLREWLDNLADDLTEAGANRLKAAAAALGITAAEGPPDDDPALWARLVARRLLHFGSDPVVAGVAKETFDDAAQVLKKAVRTFPPGARERVANQFFPVWVHPDAARNIGPRLHPGRPVVINGTYWETGRHYADRATCGQASERRCVISVPEIHDGNPQAIVEEYHAELKMKLRLDSVEPADWNDPDQLKAWTTELKNVVDEKGQIFVVLWGDGRHPDVVADLRKKYAPFVILIMVGDAVDDLSGYGEVALLEPLIPARREGQVLRLYNELL